MRDKLNNISCNEAARADARKNLDWATETIQELLNLYRDDPDAGNDEFGSLREYGLEFRVEEEETETYEKGREYLTFTWVLATGGPHYEFQFDVRRYGPYEYSVLNVVFVFLPWFRRCETLLTGPQEALLESVFLEYFVESGIAESTRGGRPYYG